MRVLAEWNLTQEEEAEAAEAAAAARGGRRRPRGRPARPLPPRGNSQSPRDALALLAKGPNKVDTTPDAAAFWFGKGFVHVS